MPLTLISLTQQPPKCSAEHCDPYPYRDLCLVPTKSSLNVSSYIRNTQGIKHNISIVSLLLQQ